MSIVIFSIDNPHDTHAMAKFLRHIDTQSAMQKLRGKLVHCIGYWEGTLEPSFMLTLQDFNDHVKPYGYVDNQICVMECNSKDSRQPCVLVYPDGKRESVGPMVEVSAADAMQSNAWTYRMDNGKYFVAK
jgi:hypothetical protein